MPSWAATGLLLSLQICVGSCGALRQSSTWALLCWAGRALAGGLHLVGAGKGPLGPCVPVTLRVFFSHPVTISYLQHANSLKKITFLFVWLQKVFPRVFSLHENNLPSPLGWDCFTLLRMFGLAARTLGGTTALKRSFSLYWSFFLPDRKMAIQVPNFLKWKISSLFSGLAHLLSYSNYAYKLPVPWTPVSSSWGTEAAS